MPSGDAASHDAPHDRQRWWMWTPARWHLRNRPTRTRSGIPQVRLAMHGLVSCQKLLKTFSLPHRWHLNVNFQSRGTLRGPRLGGPRSEVAGSRYGSSASPPAVSSGADREKRARHSRRSVEKKPMVTPAGTERRGTARPRAARRVRSCGTSGRRVGRRARRRGDPCRTWRT